MSSEPSGPTQPEHVSAVDAPYTFGRPPSTYLSPREIVRVTILRSRLGAAADSELTRLPMSIRASNAETTSVAIVSTEPQP